MSSEQRAASRLHPLSLPFSMLSHLGGYLVPIVLVVAFSKNLEWESWTFLFLVPILFIEAWRYFTLRYWITADELVVTEGILFKEERHIPLARIQTVDSTQNLPQRLLGVVEVRVETAGSSKPEAHLKVLSVEARDALRAGIFARKPALPDEPLADNPACPEPLEAEAPFLELYRVGPSELGLLGLNLGRGLALLAVFFGLASQVGLLDELHLGAGLRLFRETLSGLAESGLVAELVFEFLIAAGLVGLIFALSVGSVMLRLFDFRLERRGDEFRTQCGLFTRHATTIPKGRVQFISIQAPLSLRLFGRALVKVRTAGGRSEGDKTSATREWLIPVLPEGEVADLVRELVPSYQPGSLEWHGVAPGARARLLRRAMLTALLANTPLFLFWSSWGLVVAAVSLPASCVLLGALAWLRAARLAWADTGEAFLIQDGVVNHRVAIVPGNRLQSAAVSTSPFDRLRRMARLSLDTAGPGIGHRASLGYLARDVAQELARSLAERAEAEAAAQTIDHPVAGTLEAPEGA